MTTFHPRPPRTPPSGFTLIELMIALVVFSIISLTLVHHLTLSHSANQAKESRIFAYTKAQTILAEMHSLVDTNSDSPANLDNYDDGASLNATLSITAEDNELVRPDHPISGNSMGTNGWKWFRRIKVRPFASVENRSVRYVTVSIYQVSPEGEEREFAALSSVINTQSSGFPTTQVYDVYLLAVENIPGWWVFMENIVPSVEAAITDLESRNPGLNLRTHWITKASYGRNQGYMPYINAAVDSNQQVDQVYYYPGRMPTGNASNYYYVPSMIKARVNQDGSVLHGYNADTNPHPYALADFYNHGMRLLQERELHELRIAAVRKRKGEIAAARAAQMPTPAELDDMSEEPTLRLLLEDMNTDPEKYRHALLINLHGELAPMPSIRNYSDPAKTPVHPGLRVVTHPEEIRTRRDPVNPTASDDVYLRVYAYSADPGKYYTGTDPVAPVIQVDVMDVDLRGDALAAGNRMHADGWIRAMQGGTSFNGVRDYPDRSMTNNLFPNAKAVGESPAMVTNEMRYELSFETLPTGRRFTRIKLHNTPIRCDQVGGRGLATSQRARLYSLEYQPAPTLDKTFDRDLSQIGDRPKNTARWRIRIPAAALGQASRWFAPDGSPSGAPAGDVTLVVRTHVEDGSVTGSEQPGRMFPTPVSPENLSETYTWWASQPGAVPMTERSQFLGDPRCNPYKDLLDGDADFPNGYNWTFAGLDLNASSDFPGIVRHLDRWNGMLRQDAARYFELLRSALVNSSAIYTTLTGYSYYYMGHGNEIGYDSANGYPLSIPTNLQPFGGAAGATGTVNNITGYRRYVREQGTGTDFWWGMPWLGELYPDSAYATQWSVTGNLRAGSSGANQFYRAQDSLCFASSRFRPFGTTASSAIQRTSVKGSVAFMNNGTSAAHFNHHFSDSPATLSGPGIDLQQNYNFPLPDSVACNRPFTVDTSGNLPVEWTLAPYSTTRGTATVLGEYYDRGARTGSGLVMLEDNSKTRAAFIIVSGLSQTTTVGASFIAKYSILAMLQSYFEAGDATNAHRIKQTPRIEVKAPNELTELRDPTSINVLWDVDWLRWDGKKYTSGTPQTFSEAEGDIEYSLMYSRDNGKTWIQLELIGGRLSDAGVAATPGTRPTPTYLIPDAAPGQESQTWDVPAASYPMSGYLLRIDTYRRGQSLHYSQHITRFFIDR